MFSILNVLDLRFVRDANITFSILISPLLFFYSVTMKASIVCPTSTSAASVNTNASLSTSNSILYTAFIEPKAASTLGGGCGSAYVFVGTQTSISVYDLLTLQLVWTLSGEKYTAFAVAADESQLPSSHVDAWIAVSLTTTTNANANKSCGANETDTEASVDGQTKQSEQHKVRISVAFVDDRRHIFFCRAALFFVALFFIA